MLDSRLGLRDLSKGLVTAGALTKRENKVMSKFEEKENLKLDYVWASKELRVSKLSARSRPFPLTPFWYVSDHWGGEV